MQYTLILTEKTEGGIQVTIPALPACTVEAATRDKAIRLAREAIAQLVSRSEIVHVDIPQQPRATVCATVMERLRQQHRRRKRYADLMIAAIVVAGQHILATRNQADFRDVLPQAQLANWLDEPPEASLP
jgi:predicted nucleic acid-binding protein